MQGVSGRLSVVTYIYSFSASRYAGRFGPSQRGDIHLLAFCLQVCKNRWTRFAFVRIAIAILLCGISREIPRNRSLTGIAVSCEISREISRSRSQAGTAGMIENKRCVYLRAYVALRQQPVSGRTAAARAFANIHTACTLYQVKHWHYANGFSLLYLIPAG